MFLFCEIFVTQQYSFRSMECSQSVYGLDIFVSQRYGIPKTPFVNNYSYIFKVPFTGGFKAKFKILG